MSPNRLSREKSPYLLQHAENPVDWYPWGEEAFARAREEDKPVFLSIGYSTCHWCHVMEQECFEDAEVATLMNEAFVNIKVDREERPDIDNIYMTVAQLLTGQGGWPLTILMTPDQEPFFAGTYIPKQQRFGRPGMLELVPRVRELWSTERSRIQQSAGEIVRVLDRASDSEAPAVPLDGGTADRAYRQLAEAFDARYGGFGRAPKFPTPHTLLFLLRYWHRTGQQQALEMVTQTLRAMRHGGIYDQVGFGFHRYSTDRAWFVPHFEKMLYDQAMLVMAYSEAYQVTGEPLFRETVQQTCTYVHRDLLAPEGGFFSAEDADSEGEEGKFYVWTRGEIEDALASEQASLAIDIFGVATGGNFLDEATRQTTGANILHLRQPVPGYAAAIGSPEQEVGERLEAARQGLFARRSQRVRPLRDEKILTDWNGLMIAALAMAARALRDRSIAGQAERAARFLLDQMVHEGDRVHHRFKDGSAEIAGTLDDYAFLVWGLLELYQTVFEPEYLERAIAFTDAAVRHFWDAERGACFFTADDGEKLLVRPRETYDGAIPAGNSVMVLNLLRLSRLTGTVEYEDRAHQITDALSGEVAGRPLAHTQVLVGLDFALGPSQEVVVVGEPSEDDARGMLDRLGSAFTPGAVVLHKSEATADALGSLAPFTRELTTVDGRPTAYVCRGFRCELPVTDADEMLAQLEPPTRES